MSAAKHHLTALQRAFVQAETSLWAEHGGAHVHGFYVSANLLTDHIYEHCPHLRRGFDAIGKTPKRADAVLYPEAGDVCGWCLRIWRSRRKGNAA